MFESIFENFHLLSFHKDDPRQCVFSAAAFCDAHALDDALDLKQLTITIIYPFKVKENMPMHNSGKYVEYTGIYITDK